MTWFSQYRRRHLTHVADLKAGMPRHIENRRAVAVRDNGAEACVRHMVEPRRDQRCFTLQIGSLENDTCIGGSRDKGHAHIDARMQGHALGFDTLRDRSLECHSF